MGPPDYSGRAAAMLDRGDNYCRPVADDRDREHSNLRWEDVSAYFPRHFPEIGVHIAHVLPTFSASVTFDDQHTNPIGMVHGGVIATTLDVFMALLAAADSAGPQVTESLDVRFQRPWRIGRPVELDARIVELDGVSRTVEIDARQRAVVARARAQFVSITLRGDR